MSTLELLQAVKAAGIVLGVSGDRLTSSAPKGAMTPELRDALAQHKPALLAVLAPCTEFITLRNGLVLPVPALLLGLDLEQRGFKQSVDAQGTYQIEPARGLSEGDLSRIARWKLHLAAIVSYNADAQVIQ